MIGIGGLVVIGPVAGNTFRGRIGVIAVDMAQVAIGKRMSAGERELCVVKRGRFPSRIGGMTLVTRGRVPCGSVIGIGGLVVFVQVAGNTFRGRIGVIAVDMAQVAIGKGMSAGERELCVVKRGRFPSRIGGMALVTRGRVLCGNVIGIGGLVVFVQVAGNTFRGSIGIIPVDMTEIAIGKGMPAGERELCVVKCGRFPSRIGGMTLVTRGRVLCCRVIGIGGLVVIFQVAGNTFRGSIGIIPVDMTEIAVGKGMSAGERELCMVKGGRFPSGIGGMALVTRGRVLCGRVIGIGGLVVIVQVAGNTFTGQTGIGTIGMATIAFINGMSRSEWKE